MPLAIALLLFVAEAFAAEQTGQVQERRPPVAAVASAHPLATQAGLEILAAGGNAFDAAVAVSAALAVVEPRGSGVGGGGFYLLHRAADGHDVFVDAREVAPAAARRDMFLGPDGEPVPGKSLNTALAAGIPGAPAGWAHLAAKYGRLPLSRSLAPAIRLARGGFAVYPRFAEDIAQKKSQLESTSDGRRIFLAHGTPPKVGSRFRQPDLAKSLEMLAKQGKDGFYRGPFAERLVAGMHQLGGNWSSEDLARYSVVEREPLHGQYRGAQIVTAPPSSAGGVTLLEALNILSGYDLESLPRVTQLHLIVESLRRAHRDRAEYLGDPAFVSVPLTRLLSPFYAAGLRASIRMDKATPSESLPAVVGDRRDGRAYAISPSPTGVADISRGIHTTHFSVLDKQGNGVAATITLNALMGSGLVIPGTGILLNNEMDDFVVKAGVPNLYGLVGADANAIAPGKRPLSSMTPTFALSDKGRAILGSPGGSFIPTMVLLGVLQWVAGADATAIVKAPRVHHQYEPDAIFYEPEAVSETERGLLADMGYRFKPWPRGIGNMQVITWSYAHDVIVAAADPRGVGAGVAK